MSGWLSYVLEVAVLVLSVSSMLSVGLGTALGEIMRRLRDAGALARFLIANFVLVPLLTLGILRLVPLDRSLETGLLLLSAAAGAPFLVKLAEAAEARLEKSVALLVVLLPVTVLCMPLVIPLLVPEATVSAAAIALPLVLTMLLPLAVGLLIHARLNEWALRLQPPLIPLSTVALLVVIAATVWPNAKTIAGLIGEGTPILAAFAVIAGAFVIGYGLGGRRRQAREVLGLGTAQRNIAAAMVVATESFHDPRVTVMVMVTSLIALAVLFPIALAMRYVRRGNWPGPTRRAFAWRGEPAVTEGARKQGTPAMPGAERQEVHMAEQRDYDVVVIGAGSTGQNVADRVVKGGLSAVVVEEDLVGGDCSYWACMPSKALLRPAHALAGAQRVAGAREALRGGTGLAAGAVLARRDAFTSNWNDSKQVQWLDSAHIALIRGHGRLAGERRVEVRTADETVTLTARHAVALATGSEAALPPVPGLTEARPWTTKDAASASTVPPRLIVLGGGVAGCELAQAFASLGSRVSLVEMAERLLPAFEPVAGELLTAAMGEQGVEVRTGVTATGASRAVGASVSVRLMDGTVIEGDELLVAAGRKPRTGDLGLETVGLPGSWLEADDTMAVRGVAGSWLYAAGDLNHRALLTHQGKYQARACGDSIVARAASRHDPAPWSPHNATADHLAVPQVVFTDPEVAAVGATEAQARDAGLRVRAVDHPLGNVAGAGLYADGYTGHARIIVDENREVIVGATFVGPGVGELLHAATIAIVGEVPLARLWHAVPSYPTISEVWLRLLETYGL